MKRVWYIGIVCVLLGGIIAWTMPSKKKDPIMENTKVKFETSMGTIVVKLYDETPLHRDNFIKLVNNHYYDSLLFHRVIDNFMIQAGDPKSKGASAGTMLGTGGPGYTIPAEFNSNFIHKKGALAAARLGGPQNPNKESSGSQFYIVVGQQVAEDQLDAMAQNKTQQAQAELIQSLLFKPENKELLQELITLQNTDRNKFMEKYQAFADANKDTLSTLKPISYTKEQKEIYSTIGGTPHLDMDYTVFGEVIEGLEIVDSIAKVKTDRANRPLEDVIITNVTIVK